MSVRRLTLCVLVALLGLALGYYARERTCQYMGNKVADALDILRGNSEPIRH